MSALGHKQTYAVQKGMSGLPPKADICGAVADVRFGSIADFLRTSLEEKNPGFVCRGTWHFKCRRVDNLNTHQKS
jgi:hypothetical protein